MTSSTSSQGTLPQRLFQEWHQLCTRRAVLDHVRSWPLEGPPVRSLVDLLHRCGYERHADDHDADDTLRQLLRLAAHDHLAARVVLQRLLPGMLAIAHRRGHGTPAGSEPALAEVMGTMWVLVRSYPVHRRSRHLAANLLRDAEYQAFRRPARLMSHRREIPTARLVSRFSDSVDPTFNWLDDPGRRLAEALNRGRSAGLSTADLELLTRLASGESTETLATQLGVSDRTLRARRAAAVQRLRQVVAAA